LCSFNRLWQDFCGMHQNSTLIILGPGAELHTGIHGELIDTPPPGVTYFLPSHRYRFMFPTRSSKPFDPFQDFAVSQTVEFAFPAGHRAIVHSSRIPVFNRVPWLADMDCLLATLNAGTFFALGTEGRAPNDQRLVRQRQRLMLSHYLSEHCTALLFWTEYARQNLLSFIEELELLEPPDHVRLAEKTDVLRPTAPWRGSIEQKEGNPTIIYMGRFHESKGGEVALEVFQRIHERYGDQVGLVYVGPLPEKDRALPTGINFHPVLDRATYLKVLSRGHIFLSPTEFESYGFGFVEAASHGLAIVTHRGPGMEHIEELFQQGKNALFVPAQETLAAKIEAYEQSVRFLLDSEGRLGAFYAHNLELFRTGRLSLEVRDRKLLGYYARMQEELERANGGGVPAQSASFARERGLESCILSDSECQRLRLLRKIPGRVIVH
jgi:glycosyltransferase involved in cell wall biosynthesis